MSYYGHISTTDFNSTISDANCYFAYVTNAIRFSKSRGRKSNLQQELRGQLALVLFALSGWQQNSDGTTYGFSNAFGEDGFNALIGWLKSNVPSGCIAIPADPPIDAIPVLPFLTSSNDYIIVT
jgi:hypothetical protein